MCRLFGVLFVIIGGSKRMHQLDHPTWVGSPLYQFFKVRIYFLQDALSFFCIGLYATLAEFIGW